MYYHSIILIHMKRYMAKEKKIKYDYIHGKANINKNVKTSNLVLGIDEYLNDERKDSELEFLVFKNSIKEYINLPTMII